VIFDNSGNGNHYSLSGIIANDKPDISGLTTGYDVDDSGTVQAINADSSAAGPLVTLTSGQAPAGSYLAIANVSGQTDNGYVVQTNQAVSGIRIAASGHDALTVCTLPQKGNPVAIHPEEDQENLPNSVIFNWTFEGDAAVKGYKFRQARRAAGQWRGGRSGRSGSCVSAGSADGPERLLY
jgi:hypothetical protein